MEITVLSKWAFERALNDKSIPQRSPIVLDKLFESALVNLIYNDPEDAEVFMGSIRTDQEVKEISYDLYQVISERKIQYYRRPRWWPYWIHKIKKTLELPEEEQKVTFKELLGAIAKINTIESRLLSELYQATSLANFTKYCQENAITLLPEVYPMEEIDWNDVLLPRFCEVWGTVTVYRQRVINEEHGYRAEIDMPRWMYDLEDVVKYYAHIGCVKQNMPEKLETWGDLLKLLQWKLLFD